MPLLFAISFNLFNDRFIILMCNTKKLYFLIACFGCTESDHILYLKSKLIFQRNGLFVFYEIVTIIITSSII